MKEKVKLTTRNKLTVRDRALLSLLQGEVIVVAAEHGYMYLCDAFNQVAVSRLHTLRGDAPGTAAQVLVGKVETLGGLAKDFDAEWKSLAATFWPGLLTMQLAPQPALHWDLGDERVIPEFAVRIPGRAFLHSLLLQSGPLVAASVAFVGHRPILDLTFLTPPQEEVGLIVDEGVLTDGPVSTVLKRSGSGALGVIEVLREGAITFSELKAVVPSICPLKP